MVLLASCSQLRACICVCKSEIPNSFDCSQNVFGRQNSNKYGLKQIILLDKNKL